MERHHGFRTRGLSAEIEAIPQGFFHEGRFGRKFEPIRRFGRGQGARWASSCLRSIGWCADLDRADAS